MNESLSVLRSHACSIWQAAVGAARPEDLVRAALADPALGDALAGARRILVVGAGKAGAAMSAGVEEALSGCLDRIEGLVNVPAELAGEIRGLTSQEIRGLTPPARHTSPARHIRLHAARPAATNQPTADGVAGTRQILDLLASAGPQDAALCLISGGGSALLPAPVEGVTLEDKQQLTRLLHACGATINEMNCVRKHLSACKGGRLARTFTGGALFSLIISDVIGDPVDVIASGPTAADPTTFRDALAVLEEYRLTEKAAAGVLRYLEKGARGDVPETLKVLPDHVHNFIIGNNARSLRAARQRAEELGYRVLNLGSFIEGETRHVATAMAGIVRSIRADGQPLPPPACLLSGGETTVTLPDDHGLGGRNQEFVLAALVPRSQTGVWEREGEGLANVVVLSGGTDGEDGPTDAAGAIADVETLRKADRLGLSPAAFLDRHDAYHFFQATGDLLRTGLTQTNVMDVRVILIA